MFPWYKPPGMASQQRFHDPAFHQTSPELHQSQQPAFQEPKNHDIMNNMIIKVYGSKTAKHTIFYRHKYLFIKSKQLSEFHTT